MSDRNNRDTPQIDTIIMNALRCRDDISFLEVTASSNGSSYFYEGGPRMLSADVLFDNCSDCDKRLLISFFLSDEFLLRDFSWNINVEFAKLSAKYGKLAQSQITQFIKNAMQAWHSHFLQFACLGADSKNESSLITLIDDSTEDFRDGLFIACWFLNSRRVDEFLASKFKEWIDNGELECATGEFQAMKSFCCKWDAEYGKDAFHMPLKGILTL